MNSRGTDTSAEVGPRVPRSRRSCSCSLTVPVVPFVVSCVSLSLFPVCPRCHFSCPPCHCLSPLSIFLSTVFPHCPFYCPLFVTAIPFSVPRLSPLSHCLSPVCHRCPFSGDFAIVALGRSCSLPLVTFLALSLDDYVRCQSNQCSGRCHWNVSFVDDGLYALFKLE